MFVRRTVLACLAGACAAALSPAVMVAPAAAATGTLPFDEAAFAAAQADDRVILVEVTAPWCPTCKTQKQIIGTLRGQPRFADLVVFEIDFDSQKDLMRRFNAQVQSTLIVFRGTREAGRSVGDAQAEWIEALLETAL